jgi:hypothetical protein
MSRLRLNPRAGWVLERLVLPTLLTVALVTLPKWVVLAFLLAVLAGVAIAPALAKKKRGYVSQITQPTTRVGRSLQLSYRIAAPR